MHHSASISGKALLFGEYGVLHGYPAVAVNLPDFNFYVTITFAPSNKKHTVISDFFGNTAVDIWQTQLESFKKTFPNYPKEHGADWRFFACLLLPYLDHLANTSIKIQIVKSFSPALGFGSSSALLSGIHLCLHNKFYSNKSQNQKEELWQKLRTSLLLLQGGGSGYDAAVQLMSAKLNTLKFWKYVWNPSLPDNTPECLPLTDTHWLYQNKNELGFFLKSNIYSNTSQAIQKFQDSSKQLFFAEQHGELAKDFLKITSLSQIAGLMKQSRKIAHAQGILPQPSSSPQTPWEKLCTLLEDSGISYKSMGAGHGDCIWVLADSKTALPILKLPYTALAYDFGDNTSHQTDES